MAHKEAFMRPKYIAEKNRLFRRKLEAKEKHQQKVSVMKLFEYDFESYYNSETDCVDFEEIKPLCDFNNVMSICEFVAEKYDEYDLTIESSHFGDKKKMLRAYIYFYMEEHHKQEFIHYIEEFDFESNDDEETEELPPAQ
mgnify:CR=1 FL=1